MLHVRSIDKRFHHRANVDRSVNVKEDNIVKMAAGEHFSIALGLLGTALFGFGRSDYGQLGLYDNQQRAGSFESLPKEISFPDVDVNRERPMRFVDITAGGRHCFATTDASFDVVVESKALLL